MKFNAVMIDETGCEFGVGLEAGDREQAYDRLADDYPESRVDQLETLGEAKGRENRMLRHIEEGGDWDDEGRPIFHYTPMD